MALESNEQTLDQLVIAIAGAAEKLMDARAREDAKTAQQASDTLNKRITECLEYEEPALLEMATYAVGLLPPAEGYQLIKNLLSGQGNPMQEGALKLAVYALPVKEAQKLLDFARAEKNIEAAHIKAHGEYTLVQLMELREKALSNFGPTPSP